MSNQQGTITWDDFAQIDLRAGTITRAEPFPEARKPAYKLWIDFGDEIGILASSAQITERYNREELVGKQVLGVVNFPTKQIGPFMSECLITGIYDTDGSVVLAVPDQPVPNGTRLG
jgi:tRNA-binding protein